MNRLTQVKDKTDLKTGFKFPAQASFDDSRSKNAKICIFQDKASNGKQKQF